MLNRNLLGLITAIQAVVATSQSHFALDGDDSPWTTFPHPITRVAVIGAGPAGLQAAANLLSLTNFTVRLFERAPSPGGTCSIPKLLLRGSLIRGRCRLFCFSIN
jgi:NADPH-dependent glutamate synthase beta subunit-like oxidoreductase